MKTTAFTLLSVFLSLARAANLRADQRTNLNAIWNDPEAVQSTLDALVNKELGIQHKNQHQVVDTSARDIISNLEEGDDEHDDDRELQLGAAGGVCRFIERLFSNNVICVCDRQSVLAGTVGFQCVYATDMTVGPLVFKPSYTGVFSFRLLEMTYTFTAGICADDLAVFTNQYGFLNLGDFCFGLDYTISYSREGGLQTGIDSCTVQGGSFVTCGSCTPCTTASGGTGIALNCDNAAIAVDCLPINLPFIRDSPEPSGESFFDEIDMDGAIEMAIEQRSKELALEEEEAEAGVEEEGEKEDKVAEKKPKDKKKEKKSKDKKIKKEAKQEEAEEQIKQVAEDKDEEVVIAPVGSVPEEDGTPVTGRKKLWNRFRGFFS